MDIAKSLTGPPCRPQLRTRVNYLCLEVAATFRRPESGTVWAFRKSPPGVPRGRARATKGGGDQRGRPGVPSEWLRPRSRCELECRGRAGRRPVSSAAKHHVPTYEAQGALPTAWTARLTSTRKRTANAWPAAMMHTSAAALTAKATRVRRGSKHARQATCAQTAHLGTLAALLERLPRPGILNKLAAQRDSGRGEKTGTVNSEEIRGVGGVSDAAFELPGALETAACDTWL